MAVLSPLLDVGIALLFIAGSPSVGYVILRSTIVSSAYWHGWKRLAGATALGGVWSVSVLNVFSPLAQQTISIVQLVDYAAYAGGGLFLLTGLVSVTNRLFISRALSAYFNAHPSYANAKSSSSTPASNTFKRPPIHEGPSGRAFVDAMYKPSQLRAPVSAPLPAELGEPTLENDVLSLLKEENLTTQTRAKPKPTSGEVGISDLLGEPRSAKRSPMQDLGEMAGFEETLAQLQRDLKDFNENVTKTHVRVRKKMSDEKNE